MTLLLIRLTAMALIVGLLLPGVAVAAYFLVALYLVSPFGELARSKSARSGPDDAARTD